MSSFTVPVKTQMRSMLPRKSSMRSFELCKLLEILNLSPTELSFLFFFFLVAMTVLSAWTWPTPSWCSQKMILGTCWKFVWRGRERLNPGARSGKTLRSLSGAGTRILPNQFWKSAGSAWKPERRRKSKDEQVEVAELPTVKNVLKCLTLSQVHFLCSRPWKNWDFTRGLNNLHQMPWWLGG